MGSQWIWARREGRAKMAPLLTQIMGTMASAIEHLSSLGLCSNDSKPTRREQHAPQRMRSSKPRVAVFGRGNVSDCHLRSYSGAVLMVCLLSASPHQYHRFKGWDCCSLAQLSVPAVKLSRQADGWLLSGSKLAEEWDILHWFQVLVGADGVTPVVCCCWAGWDREDGMDHHGWPCQENSCIARGARGLRASGALGPARVYPFAALELEVEPERGELSWRGQRPGGRERFSIACRQLPSITSMILTRASQFP
jgi:hypothetical protein